MIGKIKKILFLGLKQNIDLFFSEAQKIGYVEFISPKKKSIETPLPIRNIFRAIRILKKLSHPEDKIEQDSKSVQEYADRIVFLHGEQDRLQDEEKMLFDEIEKVMPFGDFSKEDVSYVLKEGKRILQYLCIKSSKALEIELPEELIYVGTEYDLDYFVAVNREPVHYHGFIELEIKKSLSDLKKELREVKKKIRLTEMELRCYAGLVPRLKAGLIERLDEYNLKSAKETISFPMEESIFSVEAWVPEDKLEELEKFVAPMDVSFEIVEPDPNEKVPTYMENEGVAKIGEDLVNIYDTPSTQDSDPSMWVLIFFALFYGMIVYDIGYGFCYFFAGLFLRYKFKKSSQVMKRLAKLTLILGISSIVCGVFLGSYFGNDILPNSRFDKYVFINALAEEKASYHLAKKDDVYEEWQRQFPKLAEAKNGREFLNIAAVKDGKETDFEAFIEFKRNIFMELALFIGALHITLSLLRYSRRNKASIGWVIFIIGAYLYLPSQVDATSFLNFLNIISKEVAEVVGLGIIIAGVLLALVLAVVERGLKAIAEIQQAMQIFADILSYLRIYALGLAGGIMAATCNSMGAQLIQPFGFLAILLGHFINFNLGIMSGVIHGLRLNFLEWYRYSFLGDGKLFNPLKLLNEQNKR